MKQPKDYIIFPLDVPTLSEAKDYANLLRDDVGMFKVGLELFIRSGPEIVTFLIESIGSKVFLDLKLHDIPTTVSRATERIAELGVTFATVHCGESLRMLQAAVHGSRNRVGLLGVTVLTSIVSEDIRAAGFQEPFAADMTRLVEKRAAMAKAAGFNGVVCSGHEAAAMKQKFGADFLAVTPGIRPAWEGVGQDDQGRVMTPAEAVKNGADYLVIGRPIRDAKDPKEAAIRIADEIHRTLA